MEKKMIYMGLVKTRELPLVSLDFLETKFSRHACDWLIFGAWMNSNDFVNLPPCYLDLNRPVASFYDPELDTLDLKKLIIPYDPNFQALEFSTEERCFCVVCEDFKFTKFVSKKVTTDNKKKYENFFGKQIYIGSCCVECYRQWKSKDASHLSSCKRSSRRTRKTLKSNKL